MNHLRETTRMMREVAEGRDAPSPARVTERMRAVEAQIAQVLAEGLRRSPKERGATISHPAAVVAACEVLTARLLEELGPEPYLATAAEIAEALKRLIDEGVRDAQG